MSAAAPFVDPAEDAPAGDAFYAPPPLPAEGEHGDPVYQRRLDNDTEPLGVHFATVDHDTPALIAWLDPLLGDDSGAA